ncbi:cytochrome P450 [Auriscalpium vulgare]|uniref:Cytochrome P450 n=1 Tax=Auriscalpium vulgare TaxID=40419 RepID=A0ACB8RLW5_9AGAM|nr:cytochrome P450 [Auriscalpium vulgare]
MGLNVVLAAILLCTVAVSKWISTGRRRLPPGPPQDPLIGNLRHLTSGCTEETFRKWGKTYGSDIIHAKVFGRSIVILNSQKAARDLMEKRSLNYSCRPRLVLIAELMGWDSVITNLPYGDRFRKHRRMIWDHFNPQSVMAFRPLQRSEACVFLLGLAETPEELIRHVRRFTAATIMKIAYGHTVKSVDELYVRLAEEAGYDTVTGSANYGAVLVDFFPALKYIPSWMPGAGFKRRALETREKVQQMLDAPFRMVQRRMAAGTAIPSFTSSLLVQSSSIGIADEEDIKGAAGVLYAAATDTTTAMLESMFLLMVMHPAAFARAQAEIDSIIGRDRLPEFDDRSSLPYLDCVLKEIYRQCNAPSFVRRNPLTTDQPGLPHRSVNDDQYCGFDIPADTVVIPNIWAMTRDESIYANPNSFIPERFLNQDRATAEVTDPRRLVFGFGRRECPGQSFADANLWLIAACVLATFNVSPSYDEVISPPAVFVPGIVRHPAPFKCDIKLRPGRSLELIEQTAHVVA